MRMLSRRFVVLLQPAVILIVVLLSAVPAAAQVPLSAVNEETTVRAISFRFVEGRTLNPSALEDRIWHGAPGFWDRVTRFLPFIDAPRFPFSPVELQRDVRRLERYYQQNGFLHPNIDYPASQIDTTDNRIHIIFTVREGPPLIIQDVGFFVDEGVYVAQELEGRLRESWIQFRDDVTLETGNRYTDFEGVRLQDEILTWFKDSGFAFARVNREAVVDSAANTVDLRFFVDSGPRGYVSEIQIEGNESVSDEVVLRELPLSVGDRFSAERLAEGQRELFELNLFRVVIADVPEQPEDSSVVVRYRLREARPRHVSAQTGYGLDQGALLQGTWTHRNFLGGARLLSTSATFSSGFGAARVGGFSAAQQKSVSATLRQPYLFSRKLSASINPSYLRGEDERFDLRYEEMKVNTTLLYSIYNFRTVTFRHSISRATPLGETETLILPDTLVFEEQREIDIFTQNAFTLSASLGRVDDYFRPSSGFRVRPLAEMGGVLINLPDDVDYFKLQNEILGYLPIGGDYALTGRLFLGNIWPQSKSAQQTAPQIEYRFDRIRYYAGGANDVRGWPADYLGPKIPRADTARTSEGEPRFDEDGNVIFENFHFEPAGGLGKIAANVELRTPFPLFGEAWKGAFFLDMGQVYPSDVTQEVLRLRDVSFKEIQLGTGFGLRYETLVGFLRFDLGFKINPTLEDLASAEDVYLHRVVERIPRSEVETSFWNRFRFHLSIGQTF